MKKETKNSKTQEEIAENPAAASAVAAEEQVPVSAPENKADDKEGKVGLLLKEVRQKQGKSIAEISQELCIRKVYLSAIEDSDYDRIPEYPYGIGFIRSYADYLGLDGVNIVQMYKEEAEANLRKNNPYFVMEPQVEATVPSKKYLMISLIAVFAVYFVWSMYNRMSSETVDEDVIEETMSRESENTGEGAADYPLKVEDFSTNEAVSAEEELPVIDATAAEENNPQVVVKETSFIAEPDKTEAGTEMPAKAEVKTEAVPSAVEEQTAEVKPAREEKGLVIKVKKDTWIEVKNDEKLYLSKVLMPGESYTVPRAENLKLSVGKADGVDVTYNGQIIYTIAPNKKMNISVDEILAQTNH